MSGGDFKPVPLTKVALDPTKHVNYVLGMVLGVDDFEQEFAYLAERDKLLSRALFGYGTVRGLRVGLRSAGAAGPEVVVTAGIALTPRGEIARVPVAQCARINEWLKAGKTTPNGPGPGNAVIAHVVLSYQARTTDPVPIPGEPCRTESEILADSRVADGFQLELRLEKPEQREEDALRAYLQWLEGVERASGPGTSPDALAEAVIEAAWTKGQGGGTPPLPQGAHEPKVFGSHPDVKLSPANAHEGFSAGLGALAAVRAQSVVLEATADGSPPGAEGAALLLATLTIPVDSAEPGSPLWKAKTADGSDIEIDESDRPRLLSLRHVTEALLAATRRLTRSAVTHTGPAGERHFIAAAGQVLVRGKKDTPEPKEQPATGGLRAWASADGEVTVTFQPLGIPKEQYVVQVLPGELPPLGGAPASYPLVGFSGSAAEGEFKLRVTSADKPVDKVRLQRLPLMIQVTAFTRP